MPDAASQTDIVIAGAARTPMGGFQGELSPMTAPQLGGAAISAALADAGASPDAVNELVMGCVLPAGLGQAPARQAGLPPASRIDTCLDREQGLRLRYAHRHDGSGHGSCQ